ncbi:cation diffusion facilitator family transporter [Desulfatibacillum aliphaticivorans]|uniref:cation diffusion facilitator family transporter n=1 Tax=Desulfatibacillum aliphaticivorans TaxID=218208 RepID=UPI00040D074A|nr:cation diffusion facilitator family transporter [Desulfatibacillum aliphaticivorans]
MEDVSIQVKAGYKVTLVGLIANVALVGLKLALGVMGRSQALIADAVHSVSDLFSDFVVILGLHFGRKTADDRHHFGHGRLETMATTVVSVFLAAAGIGIGVDAGRAIYFHTTCPPSWIALIGAGLSILVKELLYRYTAHVGNKIKSKVVVANAWHHRSDAWSSVAVFAGVAGAQFNPDLAVLDSYAALLVSFVVLMVGVKMFWATIKELTDAAPDPDTLDRINGCICGVPGVQNVHDLKVRTSADMLQMQVHIVVDGDLSVRQGHSIAKEVEKCLFDEISEVVDVVVHVDPADD